MWSQVQKMLQSGQAAPANDRLPHALPLRKTPAALNLDAIEVGQAIRFSAICPLKPLAGHSAYVLAFRQYRFGADVLKNYQLQIGRAKHFFLTIAEDAQGQYLSLSRALSEAEQDSWFGRDALGFFTERSTAKSIRCKADLVTDGDWAADRYSKTVDWVEGQVTKAGGVRGTRNFHYNLLVNASGEKALEIEHDDASGENRIFVTVYRPIEDIAAIEDAAAIPEGPQLTTPSRALPEIEEPPLFAEPTAASPKQRPDFRRLDEPGEASAIHIARTALSTDFSAEEAVTLPAFLVARDGDYLSLDEVIPPEPERVRVGLKTARTLIERAMGRNVRVRDVLREMLGLESALAEEVIFELPLSEEDYRTLAMRFKLRPDHRPEIRSRLEEELTRLLK